MIAQDLWPCCELEMVWLMQKSFHNTTLLPSACSQYSQASSHEATENTSIIVSVNKQILLAISHTGKVIRKPDSIWWFCSLVLSVTLDCLIMEMCHTEHTVAFQIKVWKSQSIQIKLAQKRKCFIHQNNLMFQVESTFSRFKWWGGGDIPSDQNNTNESLSFQEILRLY